MAKIWKRGDRNTWVVDYNDAGGRRHRLYAENREAAEDLLAKKIQESREALLPTENSKITVAEYGKGWLASMEGEVSRSTLVGYESYFRLHIVPALGAVRMRDVTRAHIKRLLEAKRESGLLSRRMIQLIRTTISGMFANAIDDNVVKTNPATGILRQRGRRKAAIVAANTEALRPFTEDEVARLLDTGRGEERTLILVLVRTGVRPGEAYGLRWSDIDFTKREMLIERSISGSRLGPTKTGKSRRVDLSREVAAALRELHILRQRQTLQHGWGEVPEPVFINNAGRVLDSAVVHKQFRSIMKRAEIGGHTLYDLRHTFASRHLELGSPLTYVAAQLGHSKPIMTLKYYSHWLPRADKSLADRLDSAAALPGVKAISA